MKKVRRLILVLSGFIGAWMLASFAGVMFDSGNAAFWSTSLMWSLLSSLIIMPALVMVNHASKKASKNKAAQSSPQRAPAGEEEPFIQEEADETRTLWPEPEQNTDEWPPQETVKEEKEERVRA